MPDYSPERWAELSDLLGEALERPEAEREAFLETVYAEDPTLRPELDRLLASYRDAEAEARFERGALDVLPSAFADPEPSAVVGAYRLLREIGRGGMGRVWLAERADGVYEQRVAVKTLHAGIQPEVYRRRFAAERRILARLDHPHIARILDGGLSEEGQPYLVMELVEGVPITTYCAERDCTLEERLALFRTVCDAVAYAHQNLVVHRDLKPGNILVTEDGTGQPVVKLLDFGIAKLLGEPEDTDDLPITRTGMALMTPEYAAPEQITGDAITTATDVYALGVILFELLTGTRPYAFESRSPTAIEQAVCRDAPTRPSAAARSRPVELGLAGTPERLARALRGDLDTIILKALRKEPERRYASAAHLADDLRRHADGLPVTARPDTPAYRIQKFVGRHRVGVAASAAVMLALVAGLVVSVAQARIANAERDRAEAVSAFLQDMLAAPDPYADGPEVRVVEVLDRAGDAIAERFGTRPATEAALRRTLGTSYLELGVYEQAEPHLARALALARGTREEAAVLAEWGSLQKRLGEYEAADSAWTRALELERRRYGPDHPRVADRLGDLGALRWEQGDYDAAEPLLRDALAMTQRHTGVDSTGLATAYGQFATLRSDQGFLEEAETLYRRELALLRVTHGERHPGVAQAISHLAIVRDDLEDHDTAAAMHAEALALFRAVRGETHPDVAYALNNLATVEIKRGHLDRADSLMTASIAVNRAALGEGHPTIGIQYNNLGSLRRRQGDAAGALDAFQRAVRVWREGLPPGHPYLAFGLQNAGAVMLSQGRVREALPLLSEAYAIRVDLLDPDHPERANTASLYGEALARTGVRPQADSLLLAAHGVLTTALGPDHTSTQLAADRLSRFRGDR